ncbi:MAG: ROK family protein [Prevotellaceae bacterium]|jgi:predicted NBD/HSP70 family sugar kinase/mannose-6-phosphate isomerase class I|nr:ROK family protein [Prevotellaceae bacterium]
MVSLKQYSAGVDMGGSHLSYAVVDTVTSTVCRTVYGPLQIKINPQGSITELLCAFEKAFAGLFASPAGHSIASIGIAMPGPFDYRNGVSCIAGVHKLDAVFGLNFRQALQQLLPRKGIHIAFENDATCFALGEYYAGAAKNSQRTLIITLGTGLGSTFMVNGQPQTAASDGVPVNGYLYNIPFGDGIADDYFSTRWFVAQWKARTGKIVAGVKEIADAAMLHQAVAETLFTEFADNLSAFLIPWLQTFKPDKLVVGGNIAKAITLFGETLNRTLWEAGLSSLTVAPCALWDEAPLIGAAMRASETIADSFPAQWRKTTQFLAPDKATPTEPGQYDIYPAFPAGSGKIQAGTAALAAWIAGQQTVVIDGYTGVFWHQLVADLGKEPALQGKKIRWFHAEAAMKPAEEIALLIAPYMGEPDTIFGRMTDATLSDWFDMAKLQHMQPDANVDINIMVGCGAALADWQATGLVYVDMPKNELQYRMRAGVVTNLGADTPADDREMYKRAFFIDWPVLDKHKCALFPRMDLVVDGQRPDICLFMTGADLRATLAVMSRNVFRVRPWFEPGAWGGTWMRDHFDGLNKEVPNLAWSFELIVNENGLMFESDGYRLEVTFDFLMYAHYEAVLGDCAAHFRYDFPIRFDFLDTFNGGNLSVQCHPQLAYIKELFGIPFTQDETYYILDCKTDAVVYLGFQEGIDASTFHRALTDSEKNVHEIPITHYVQQHPTKKHDFFLIPNGTVHASGKDNVVLEISSAPYIFTFKMYDWLQVDIDGRPRPINIEHGMKNLNFDRQGVRVQEEFISKPYVLSSEENCVVEHLPTHVGHFYDVHRYTLHTEMTVVTGGKCHVWMLVEGRSVIVETEQGMRQRFNYAETFVVPAATESYKIINESALPAVLVKAFVK